LASSTSDDLLWRTARQRFKSAALTAFAVRVCGGDAPLAGTGVDMRNN
jgi:hypothetical protein